MAKTINTSLGGLQKPVSKEVGIIFYAEAGKVEISSITASSELTEFTNAGAIHTDGITFAANSEDPEVYLDWNGNIFDSSEATQTPSINFKLLEAMGKDAAALSYDASIITAGLDNIVTKINGTKNPTNKTFVIETRVKNTISRVILPEVSFASRGDEVFGTDDLYANEVTYNILSGETGQDIIRYYRPVAGSGE